MTRRLLCTKRIPKSDRDTLAHMLPPSPLLRPTWNNNKYTADRMVLRAKLIRKRGSRGTMGADSAFDGEHGKGTETVGRTWERPPTQWRPSWRSDLRPPGCAPPTSRIRIRIRCFDCVLMLRTVSTTAALRHSTPRLSISFCLCCSLIPSFFNSFRHYRRFLDRYRCSEK